MCLAVPGKIIEIYDSAGMRMCKIDFGGVTREACLQVLPDAKVGDFTIVHAGFALNILSESEALETLEALRELGEIESEINIGDEG
ncbi:hydrogenase assembly protein HypC [Leptolinea sp. HRD-7]|nr:hydrogenase assembly protein HypC [Leptolinea sp. HRD-7]